MCLRHIHNMRYMYIIYNFSPIFHKSFFPIAFTSTTMPVLIDDKAIFMTFIGVKMFHIDEMKKKRKFHQNMFSKWHPKTKKKKEKLQFRLCRQRKGMGDNSRKKKTKNLKSICMWRMCVSSYII